MPRSCWTQDCSHIRLATRGIPLHFHLPMSPSPSYYLTNVFNILVLTCLYNGQEDTKWCQSFPELNLS
jgi:hypothetical protein